MTASAMSGMSLASLTQIHKYEHTQTHKDSETVRQSRVLIKIVCPQTVAFC